jgi:hypothetical protein
MSLRDSTTGFNKAAIGTDTVVCRLISTQEDRAHPDTNVWYPRDPSERFRLCHKISQHFTFAGTHHYIAVDTLESFKQDDFFFQTCRSHSGEAG